MVNQEGKYCQKAAAFQKILSSTTLWALIWPTASGPVNPSLNCIVWLFIHYVGCLWSGKHIHCIDLGKQILIIYIYQHISVSRSPHKTQCSIFYTTLQANTAPMLFVA